MDTTDHRPDGDRADRNGRRLGALLRSGSAGRRRHHPGAARRDGALTTAARRAVDWDTVVRLAGERSSGERPELATKRSLVALSHAIERALLAGPIEPPTVVFAFFQRVAYFEREREIYGRLVERGAHVVVAFTDGEAHEVPAGVHAVVLDPSEPLADEWSVVALGPRAGAFLVAGDQHRFDASERDLEAARLFSGRWGYAHTQAAAELARLRIGLGRRLDPALADVVDGLLASCMPAGARSASSSGTPAETWATTSLHHMVERMQTARAGTQILREQLVDAHAAADARTAASVDPQSGLPDPDFLDRWTNTGGTTVLPVGVGLFDVAGLDDADGAHGPRAGYHAARRVAASLTEPLGPVDVAVRLTEREFAVVVPGASPQHLARLCDDIAEQLRLASDGYPGIDLRPSVATIVTTARPLPLDDLHEALGRLTTSDGPGPFDAGTTPGGDAVTVVGPGSGPGSGEGPWSGEASASLWATDASTTGPLPTPVSSTVSSTASAPSPSPVPRTPDGPRRPAVSVLDGPAEWDVRDESYGTPHDLLGGSSDGDGPHTAQGA